MGLKAIKVREGLVAHVAEEPTFGEHDTVRWLGTEWLDEVAPAPGEGEPEPPARQSRQMVIFPIAAVRKWDGLDAEWPDLPFEPWVGCEAITARARALKFGLTTSELSALCDAIVALFTVTEKLEGN